MPKIIKYTIWLALFFSFIICQGGVATASNFGENGQRKYCRCKLAGTWRINTGLATFVPLDSVGRKFSVLVDSPLPENPPFKWIYPDAVAFSPTRGEAVRVGCNLYKFTLTKTILDENGILIGEAELSGETKFLDCDYRELVYTAKFFGFLYDAAGNLLEKEELHCFPIGPSYAERYELADPCDDLPSFTE